MKDTVIMQKRKKVLGVIGIFGALAIGLLADEPDPRPTSVYGTITAGGGPVPAGTEVTAAIDGTTFAATSVTVAEGSARFRLDVPADQATTPGREGGVDGETIRFSAGGVETGETTTWTGGGCRRDIKGG